jgi:hypothetical protein
MVLDIGYEPGKRWIAMSWVTYYFEVSSRQHEEELQRRLGRPRPTLERIPKQRSESWRRLWGRPWSRLAARLGGRPAGRVTPARR